MKNHKVHLIVALAFAILLGTASCNQTAVLPTATIAPTATLAPTPTAVPTIQPGDFEHIITVDDLERFYLLHIPPGLNNQRPVPVIFVFHGFSGNPVGMRYTVGFNDMADEVANFLIVYPTGVGGSWNAGECCGAALVKNVDEPAFIRQILSDLGTIVNIDPKRIYATGYSNGGMLSYRLACEMPDIFAAIAPVAGTSDCQSQQAVSVLHVHGLADSSVPFDGGGPLEHPPVEKVIETWSQAADCADSEQVEKLNDDITHTAYTSCQTGMAVELYTIDSGGHSWPSKYVLPVSEVIWDFFVAHPKP